MGRASLSVSFFEIVLAAVVVIGLCALGCSTAPTMRRVPAPIFAGARLHGRPAPATRPHGHPRAASPVGDESTLFVERQLRARGLHFGTDGSTRSLWGYMRTSHALVGAGGARPGDVLFFDTRRPEAEEPECADHAGIVQSVGAGGRITFVEARGGQLRESYADPARPTTRRGDRGEILNSFLRVKKVDDPEGTRYFAGEMLCGIARPQGL
jgi:hypothetical protein